MENKKVLLSVKDLHVKFRVRGRVLTAIRGVSLDFHENESVAIVGESGSGKSVFTKTFAGMLETNGYISDGSIIFSDEVLADTSVVLDNTARKMIASAWETLNKHAKLEGGADIHRQSTVRAEESGRVCQLVLADPQTNPLGHVEHGDRKVRQRLLQSFHMALVPALVHHKLQAVTHHLRDDLVQQIIVAIVTQSKDRSGGA